MIPKSFSATALQTAGLCLSRYNAEMMNRSRGVPNIAAQTGSAVHGALENYVQECYLKKTMEPSWKLLEDLFKMSFVQIFGTSDFRLGPFKEGIKMLKAWFERTDFSTFEVVSCEVKENFPVPVVIDGAKVDIPFNYIWDRFDYLGDGIYRVTDYKTNALGLSNDELRKKPQARCYSMAARIKYPDAKQIWVEFDMLRHKGPVGVVFTREDDIETWKWIKATGQRIVDTPNTDEDGNKIKVPETLNNECLFCVRKTTCGSVLKNRDAGGSHSLDLAEMIDRRAELDMAEKAAAAAKKELDAQLAALAKEQDVDKLEGTKADLVYRTSARRSVDGERVSMVLADHPKLIRKYLGGPSMRISDFEALMDDPDLPENARRSLSGLVTTSYSEPTPKSVARPMI